MFSKWGFALSVIPVGRFARAGRFQPHFEVFAAA
jgi:hypothetical protein